MAILFIIRARAGSENDQEVVLCMADGREDAKRRAFDFLRGNPDQYTVEPLTRPGDIVHLYNLTILRGTVQPG